jgi:type II secretory ATPase GspE/PulE/Tfp pilus assembly ATPase PilB-like protein/FixJ family two-component response regulator
VRRKRNLKWGTINPYLPNVISALERAFRQENYVIHTAANGIEALALLATQPCQVVVSDYLMPKMNGADLLRTIKQQYPDTIRIMLTGHADVNAVMGAVREGAVYKFILKPWNDEDLRVTISLALEKHDLMERNRSLQEQNKKRAHEISQLTKLAVNNRSQLAILLHKRKLLSDRQMQELFKVQQTRKVPVIKLILEKGWADEKSFRDILRKDLMIEEVALDEIQVDPAIAALLPRSFCEKQWVLPLKQSGRRLTLVMADPMDEGLLDDLKFSTGMEIQQVMANVEAIQKKISEVYDECTDPEFGDLETLVSSIDPYEGIEIIIEDDDDIPLTDLLQATDEPPAIRLVNAIVLEAVRLGASDIHIQPRTKTVVVRYRIDGVLQDKIQIPQNLHMSLVSRIKVMAELDITERRRPQDGRITVKTPLRIIDLRISSLPTINGEKVVMRILDRNAAIQDLGNLQLSIGNYHKIEYVMSKPQGIILATGPTGSGKTTSLYAMLQHNATAEKNYVTIEDPVEYYMDMAGQVLIRDKIGLDFASVLRAILRQDPDVILLGEIRDLETAEVAFHAALTGHVVYSTLHTNSAMASIFRLLDLGLKPYVLASALEAIIAQRLVRRICEHCKQPMDRPGEILDQLGEEFANLDTEFLRGRGCNKCNHSGYSGRVGVYEVLIPSQAMRDAITAGATQSEITAIAKADGITTLLEDARDKIKQGMTSVEEIFRVFGAQNQGKFK